MSRPTSTFLASGREPEAAFRIVGRACFLVAAGTSLAAAALLAVVAPTLGNNARLALVGSLVAYAALCAWTSRRSREPSFRLRESIYVAAVGAMLLAGAIAVGLRDGIRDPLLGILPLVVCAMSAVASARIGAVLAVFACLELLVLAALERRGLTLAGGAGNPLPLMVLLQILVVAGALATGVLVVRVVAHSLRAAAERGRRADGLLRLAPTRTGSRTASSASPASPIRTG